MDAFSTGCHNAHYLMTLAENTGHSVFHDIVVGQRILHVLCSLVNIHI